MEFEPKSRKIIAEQYLPPLQIPTGIKLGSLGKGHGEAYCLSNRGGCIIVYPGDWVIQETDGTFYPVPDELFKTKYQKVIKETPHLLDDLTPGEGH